jgi:hypothetical protein
MASAPYRIESDIWISLSAVKCVGDPAGDVKNIFCRVGSIRIILTGFTLKAT